MSCKDAPSGFACLVTAKSLEQYKKLSKKGKPKEKVEWTPMAAILQHNSEEETLKVVAMGTGSKCIGQSKMNKEGWVLNDSHAEIIARREFVRYLLNQLQAAIGDSCSSIFVPANLPSEGGCACAVEVTDCASVFSIKSGVSFHFFSTQVPCGDAAIFPQHSPSPLVGGDAPIFHQHSPSPLEGGDAAISPQHSFGPLAGGGAPIFPQLSPSPLAGGDAAISPQHSSGPCLLGTDSTLQSSREPYTPIEYYTSDGFTHHTKRLKPDTVSRATTSCCGCSIVAGGQVCRVIVWEEKSVLVDLENTPVLPGTSVLPGGVLLRGMSPDRLSPDGLLLGAKTAVMPHSCADTKADIHRTGAKCIVGGPQDTKAPGHTYHTSGVLRTKPGRGDPTLSMSCSDKILRWNVTFTVASRVFDRDALARAVFGRLENFPYLHLALHRPQVYQCVCGLEGIKEEGLASHPDRKLAPAAVGYCAAPLTHEVVVQGLKQGGNLKLPPNRTSSVSVCKHRIFEDFLKLLKSIPDGKVPQTLRGWRGRLQTYHSFKKTSTNYNRAKSRFLLSCPLWLTNSANMEQFV